jgi:hypothetical protein
MADESLDPQIGQDLHQRMLDGDPRAPAEIAELFLPWLRQQMGRLHAAVSDPHLLDTASIDAVWSYLKKPTSYQPEKLPLERYLLMAATGDLRNALERVARAVERDEEIVKNLVELDLCAPEQRVNAKQLEHLVEPILPEPPYRIVFSLMADGVHDTETYAAVLGLGDRPIEEQRRSVKACKDRILVRLRRAVANGRLKLDK